MVTIAHHRVYFGQSNGLRRRAVSGDDGSGLSPTR
jgi:hypothetical protein